MRRRAACGRLADTKCEDATGNELKERRNERRTAERPAFRPDAAVIGAAARAALAGMAFEWTAPAASFSRVRILVEAAPSVAAILARRSRFDGSSTATTRGDGALGRIARRSGRVSGATDSSEPASARDGRRPRHSPGGVRAAPKPLRRQAHGSTRPTTPSAALLAALPNRAPRGDQVGLLDGNRGKSSCNLASLSTLLAGNPALGQAWADAENISYNDVPTFLRGLTPALLRVDTRVTSYAYDGGPRPRHAVLQTGTAVLVDGLGLPRARCVGGNPLTPPVGSRLKAVYRGERWARFNPKDIVTVTPAPQPVSKFVLIDVVTNKPFVRPADSDGSADSDYSGPTSGPTSAAAPAPKPTTPTTRRR